MHTDAGIGEGNAKGTEEEVGKGETWRPEPCAAAVARGEGRGKGRERESDRHGWSVAATNH